MTWKKLNNAHFGSTSTFGGADIDKISKVFDGTLDIDEQDINSSTTIRSGKFKFRNPNDTYSYTITPSAITADRTVTFPALASDSEFLFVNAAQTISNQTLSSGCNILNPTYQGMTRIIQDPSVKRWGTFTPAYINGGASVGKYDGILAAHTDFNSDASGITTIGWTTSHGFYSHYSTGPVQGADTGIRPPTSGVGPMRTAKAGKIRARVAAFNVSPNQGFMSLYCGLTDYTTIPPWAQTGHTQLAAPDKGFFIVGSGLGNPWQLWHCDGSAFQITNILGTATDVFSHIIELSWPAGGASVTGTIDNSSSVTANTALPSSTTNLWFWLYITAHDTTSRLMFVSGVWIESE